MQEHRYDVAFGKINRITFNLEPEQLTDDTFSAVDQEGAMKKLLILAAVGEGLAGLILFVYPPIVIRLFFDTEGAGAGVLMSRVAGIALIALGSGLLA